jgi:hypothetical protein
MTTEGKHVGEVVGVSEEQFGSFLKGVSIGMLAATALHVAGQCVPAFPAEFKDRFKDVLRRNRDLPFYGLEQPLSDDLIDAIGIILTAENGMAFFNNTSIR